MSPAQREVSTNLLETVSGFKTGLLARSSGKSVAEVEALYDNDVSREGGGGVPTRARFVVINTR